MAKWPKHSSRNVIWLNCAARDPAQSEIEPAAWGSGSSMGGLVLFIGAKTSV